MYKRVSCIIMLVVLAAAPAFGAEEEKAQLRRLSGKEINQFEESANTGRQAFFRGDYETAEQTFEEISEEFTVSQPLYKCEMGATCMITGNKEKTFDVLMEAYTALEVFIDPRLEKSAAGIWGSETKKIYRGDPYEQASLCMLLGLLFLDNNDFDNALACFKTGQLADSDVANELYTSDFGLLQALEAKCYGLRNQPIKQEEMAAVAMESYLLTHPALRDLISQKQKLLDKDEAAEEPKRGWGSRTAQAAEEVDPLEILEEVEESIHKKTATVDSEYAAPLFEDWNTLVIVWSGKSPSMMRAGEYGEKRLIVKSPSPENRYEILVDEEQWRDAIQGFADVSFQATTRGGRVMDDVLANQAQVKDFTKDFGNALIDSADDVGGTGGLALLAVGLIVKGVSAAMNVEADIRCWQTLPDTFQVIPLNLKPGEHDLTVDCYDKYIKTRTLKKQITVQDKPVSIAFINVPI